MAGGFNSSPFVTYGYADGSTNTLRPTGLTYPNGRQIGFAYGSPGAVNDAASRIGTIAYGQGLVEETHYEYLGLGTIVEADHWQPSLRFTLVGTAGGDDPDTGDIYRGLDRFGRVKDLVWRDDGTNTDAVGIQHGYDRASNRLWRKDPVAASFGKRFDELYTYDGLDRLANMQRGTLNSNHTAVTNSTFAQCWSLDETGNWHEMRQDDTGAGTWDLVQTRTANPVNEITAITNSTGPTWAQPAYDAAGNMTTIPTGNPPGWSDLSVPDWSGLSLDGWATMPLAGGPDSYTATYDAWNRLVTLTDGTNTLQENEYDPRTYRIIRKSYAAGILDETRHFYYSTGWQVLEERLGGDPISADAERQFVWGLRYIDDLVRRERDTNADGTLDERLYALQDPNWNVVAIADSAGEVQERFAYSAYGVPLVLGPDFGSRQDSSFVWERLYAGYCADARAMLYDVRFRLLQPNLGGWTSRDPARYHDSAHLYLYVVSDPIRNTDPLGLAGGRHHWLSQFSPGRGSRRGQDMLDTVLNRLCKGIAFSIDSFTSDLGEFKKGGRHHWVQHEFTHNGKKYNEALKNIYNTSTDCCELMKRILELILDAWKKSETKFGGDGGVRPLTTVDFKCRDKNPTNTWPKFQDLVEKACDLPDADRDWDWHPDPQLIPEPAPIPRPVPIILPIVIPLPAPVPGSAGGFGPVFAPPSGMGPVLGPAPGILGIGRHYPVMVY